jgi:hypothetical protein
MIQLERACSSATVIVLHRSLGPPRQTRRHCGMAGTLCEPASALAASPIATLPDVGAMGRVQKPEVRAKVAKSGPPPRPQIGKKVANLGRKCAQVGIAESPHREEIGPSSKLSGPPGRTTKLFVV